jgi:hypothetical protein
MKRFFILTVFAALLLAACAGAQLPPATTPTPAAGETPLPTSELPGTGHIPADLPPAQLKALEALAAQLGITPAEIKVVQVEAVQWPDACLGVQRMGVLCAQGITSGFRIVLEASGKQYEYHTNQDGSAVIQAALGEVGGENLGQQTAIEMLAKALNLPAEQIQVAANSAVDWPDACLGIARPGIMCAQMVTPGRSIVLEVNGVQYEFHTNQDASVVVPATLALTWHREGGIAGFCDDLSIFLPDTLYSSSCAGQTPQGQASEADLLSANQREQLEGWLAQYGEVYVSIKDPASADAMTTTLTLHGRGSGQPGEAEQQELVNWAQDLFGMMNK